MRRTVLIIPGLLSEASTESYLRQSLPSISVLDEIGSLYKVSAAPDSETPEAMLLGLAPSAVSLRQGPLTVSAFGFDPPERSTHFHLSLMSFLDGKVQTPSLLATPTELETLMTAAKRLDTKLLTVLKGEELNHALVWEALGDMGTKPASAVSGQLMLGHLPEGDGEVLLRRFIDDSINLLSSLELNERRIDEGQAPFNLLWPWGQGVRTPVPNLALRRGEPAVAESSSMRFAGLTRLAGYKHGDRNAFGRGLKTKLRSIAGRAVQRELTILYIETAEELRAQEKEEELDWFVREIDRELIQPLLEDHLKTPSRLALIAPGPLVSVPTSLIPASQIGLALIAETAVPSTNRYPFDERSLEEKAVSSRDLWTLVDGAVQ